MWDGHSITLIGDYIMSKPRNKWALDVKKWDQYDLEEARYQFWIGDYKKASKLLFPLCERLIQEPLANTKEYEDGQGKPAESVYEQEEEETGTAFEGPIPDFISRDERDDDGYLIR